jgi:hypothetical protein
MQAHALHYVIYVDTCMELACLNQGTRFDIQSHSVLQIQFKVMLFTTTVVINKETTAEN